MATRIWYGGASAVTQSWSLTPGGTIEATDIFNVILTNEAGGTQTEAVVAGGTTVSAVCGAVQAQCAASTQTLFTAITWTTDSSTVTATAKVSGVPFYLSETTTETGGGAQDNQTFVAAEITASAGPMDYNTAANWSASTIPVSDDIVIVGPNPTTGAQHDIRFGLGQSAVDLQRLRVTPSYTGTIGDIQNNYYLRVDISNITTSSTPSLVVNGGHSVWIDGEVDATYADGSVGGGENALRIGGTHAGLFITTKWRGDITCADSMSLSWVYNGTCPNVRLFIGSSVTNNSGIYWTAGYVRNGSAVTNIFQSGGTIEQEAGSITAINLYGGVMFYNSAATVSTFSQWGGRMDFSRNHEAALTFTNTIIYGGEFNEAGGAPDVTYTAGIIQHGGRVDAQSNPTILTSK